MWIPEVLTRFCLHNAELPALKRDVSELKPLVQKLQTSCDTVQSEVSFLRKEVDSGGDETADEQFVDGKCGGGHRNSQPGRA